MRFLSKAKDGGPESHVTGYWLIEVKWLFSVVLLRFADGSRDSYHDHAFTAISWVLWGRLFEYMLTAGNLARGSFQSFKSHRSGPIPIVTSRRRMHRVVSQGTTWVLSFRGPWSKTWHEFDPRDRSVTTLTHGRKVVGGE
jgi:hypothetical protein